MTELPPLPPNPVDFDRPPVAEVALAVQFAAAVTDDATTLGRFWPRIQERYPIVATQPALPPMLEDFDSTQPQVMFQMLSGPPASRYWLQTSDRAGLLQVQPDRIAYNWRKEPGDVPYPRYEHIRREFVDLYDIFGQTCAEQGSELVPTWCEVTYINPIETFSMGGDLDVARILRRLHPFDLLGMGTPEHTSLAEQYVLVRDTGPYGRFYVNVSSGVRLEDNADLLLITLTVRGKASTPDSAGVVAFLDDGRDLIVRGFKDMTTAAMHVEWGLREHD